MPILGDIRNMETISRDMIEEYHNRNYVGENIYVVASGDINHDEFAATIENSFKVPKSTTSPAKL